MKGRTSAPALEINYKINKRREKQGDLTVLGRGFSMGEVGRSQSIPELETLPAKHCAIHPSPAASCRGNKLHQVQYKVQVNWVQETLRAVMVYRERGKNNGKNGSGNLLLMCEEMET